jgi:hypothetical protein
MRTGQLPPDAFNLSGNAPHAKSRLDDEKLFPLIEVMGRAFADAPFVALDLSYNNLRNQGGKAVATFMGQSRRMERIDVSFNSLGVQCPLSLSLILHHSPKVCF